MYLDQLGTKPLLQLVPRCVPGEYAEHQLAVVLLEDDVS
jgi:hypothetical protein